MLRKLINMLNLRQVSYRKSLLTILMLSSLPGIVIGFIIFIMIKSHVEIELKETHQKQLLQTARMIDDQLSTAEMYIAHWAFDPKFTENLKNLDFRYKYQEIRDIIRTLLIMEGSNPLFEQVELYVNDPEPIVFTKDGYYSIKSSEEFDRYNMLLQHEKSLYWHSADSVQLVHKIPGASLVTTHAYGALIIYMDQAKVMNLVETLTSHNEGTTFLFEDDGKLLFTDAMNEQEHEMNRAIYTEVVKRQRDSGTFEWDWNDRTFTVTYGYFSRLGSSWYYVSAAPVSSITGPVITVSKLIIGMNLIILLLAGVLAWIASRKLYSPIEKLIRITDVNRSEYPDQTGTNEFEWIEAQWNNLSRESRILQKSLDQHLPRLREGFLTQILQGHMDHFSNTELVERMRNFGWEMDSQRLIIVLIELNGFTKLEGRFSAGDEGLVTFAAANMLEEIVANSPLQGNVINFYDLSLGLLVSVEEGMSREELDRSLYPLCEQTVAAIEDILKLHATVSISRVFDNLKQASEAYDETRLALRFRSFKEGSQIIDLEKQDDESWSHHFSYPFDLEKEMVYALRIGDKEGALHYVEQFIRHMADTAMTEASMKQGVFQFLGRILHVVLQSGIGTEQLYGGIDLYSKLGELRDPEEMIQWMEQQVIGPFMDEWASRKDQHMRKYVEETIMILQEQYMKDISLEYCADRMKISPSALSKGFKAITGLNFVDYLMNIRLEKAKQLLRDTEMRISEIAEKVGYQHSYFNRLFKRKESMTPSQYREREKSKVSKGANSDERVDVV